MQQWLYCDFHIHTRWSDGKYSLDDVVALYGETGFDVIAITDHVLDSESIRRSGKPVSELLVMDGDDFGAYQEALWNAARKAWENYGMLLIPGVELTNNTDRYHILGQEAAGYLRGLPSVHQEPLGRRSVLLPLGKPRTARNPVRRVGGRQPGRPVQCCRVEKVQLHRQFRFPRGTAPAFMEDALAVRKKRRIGQGGHPQERPGVAVSLSGRKDKIARPYKVFLGEPCGWVASRQEARD